MFLFFSIFCVFLRLKNIFYSIIIGVVVDDVVCWCSCRCHWYHLLCFPSLWFIECMIIGEYNTCSKKSDSHTEKRPKPQQQLATLLLLHFFPNAFFSLKFFVLSWLGSCYKHTKKTKSFIYLFKTMLSVSRVQDYRQFVSMLFFQPSSSPSSSC